MKIIVLLTLIIPLVACTGTSQNKPLKIENSNSPEDILTPSIVVLGTIQDAGSPHIGCDKDCCRELFLKPDKDRKVVSLGVLDPKNHKTYLFEATPDLPEQMKKLKEVASFNEKETPDGIFLTHAHIGHYTGLMYLGKEAVNAENVSVYVMPKMKAFLEENGPWSQLVDNHNISIQELRNLEEIQLSVNLSVLPFTVPHRDEYSETVGYTIIGPNKKALFIPDIDKWGKWDTNIIEAISEVDFAFIDGTFFDGAEITNRDISEIRHPFIIESMSKFDGLSTEEKSKIYFIHFNHTNPALNPKSEKAQQIVNSGFNIARIYDIIQL